MKRYRMRILAWSGLPLFIASQASALLPDTLHFFNGLDGGGPQAALVQGADGNFYGTTTYGGANGYGTVFRMTTNGTLATLVSLNNTNGAYPSAGLAQGADGNLYGTASSGGAYGYGTVFKMTTNGVLTTLVSFNNTNGAYPYASLVQGADGNFYGTTTFGGANGYGTVFRMTTNGTLATLVSLNNTNGAYPSAGLVQATDGNLYGTASSGGAYGYGTVFKMTTNGTLTTLVSFGYGNGAYPDASLVQSCDSNFYGTTSDGGANGYGTVFRMTTNGTLITLASFDSDNTGAYPYAGLIQAADGNFYGTANGGDGGIYDNGTVFRMTTNGTLTTLASFDSDNTGAYPYGGLVQGADGNLYGTTSGGGTYGGGTVFRLVVDPEILTQPVDQTVAAGGAATFSVSAAGTAPLGYVWQRNGSPIAGATQASYTTNGVQVSDSGSQFSCVVSNAHGSVTSGIATLTVLVPLANDQCAGAMVISSTPYTASENTAIATDTSDPVPTCIGSFGKGVWFQFTPPFDGQIVVDTVGSDFDTVLAVYTGACGALTQTACDDQSEGGGTSRLTNTVAAGTTYYILAGGNAGQSGELQFHLMFTAFRPVIVVQPANQMVPVGGAASFSVTATGSAPLSYFWRRNGSPIAGATQSTYTTNNVQLADAGSQFSCLITNVYGAVTSSPALLGIISTAYSFNGPDGGDPQGGLVQGADGNFYGTTAYGGTYGYGSVFRMTTNGVLSPLASFNSTNGVNPYGGLVPGADGNWYGTAAYGGAHGYGNGTVFKMTPNGTVSNLASFNYEPNGGLIQGADGKLYGTTQYGGASGEGTVFSLTTNGTLTTLTSFNGPNGSYPSGGLVQGADGTFYGTTPNGGAYSYYGTVFRITTNGTLTTLVSFNSANNGGYSPSAGLVQGADGNLYGTSQYGGTYGAGTLFSLTTNGTLTTLGSLPYGNGSPNGGLIRGADGSFYGTTSSGGPNGSGTVFSFTTNGTLTTLFSFAATNGATPQAGLVQGRDGRFYGTTAHGGLGYNGASASGDGTVFRLTFAPIAEPPAITAQPVSRSLPVSGTAVFTVNAASSAPLGYFWRRNGSPIAGATQSSYTATNLQVAASGSQFSCLVSNALGSALSSNAVLTVLAPDASGPVYSFSGADGGLSQAGLVRGADGQLYGTTSYGGAYGYGTVFSMTTNGLLSTLASFNNTNGASPQAALVQGTDGNFYGTTVLGGTYGYGTVFRVSTNGTLVSLTSFDYYGPNSPDAGLVQGADGNFYGTTPGSYNSSGTVFWITTNGTLTTLVYWPSSVNPLIGGADGNLYGTTATGGTYGYGTVFRVTTNGALTTLVSFTSANGGGYYPEAGLVQGTDGNFYGTTSEGGTNGDGTVFRITPNGALTTLASFDYFNNCGIFPHTSLVQGADGNFYGTTDTGGPNGSGAAFLVTTNGAMLGLLAFSPTSGAPSEAPLVQGSDGNFYGTTLYGGNGYDGASGSGNGAVFRLVAAPFLITQPASQTVAVGGSATFSVSAGGSVPLGYAWQRNGTPIAGATQASYTVSNVQLSDSGSLFSCLVTNSLGSLTSSNATLTVVPPLLNDQCAGATLISASPFTTNESTLLALSTGDPAPACAGSFGKGVWFQYTAPRDGQLVMDTVGSSFDTVLALYTGACGALTQVVCDDNGGGGGASALTNPVTAGTTYHLLAGGAAGQSGNLVLHLTFTAYAPTIVTPPASQVVATGGTASFSVTATGNAPLSYSWRRNGSPIAGATQSTYTTNNVQLADAGSQFSCLVTNVYGAVTSSPALLGIFSTAYSFSGPDGGDPQAAPAPAADGNLYGTTTYGGAYGYGSVYRLTPGGTLSTLASFTNTDSGFPRTPPVRGADGNFYGTTAGGGYGNYGTVFRMTTNGMLSTLVHFDYYSTGAYPSALIQGPDGNFYGTTSSAYEDYGTVFRVTTNGTLTTLVYFDYNGAGASPQGSLVQGADGNFYGTTPGQGDYSDYGTVFRMTPDGTLTTLVSFTAANNGGYDPNPGLVQGGDGNLYGTTQYGGTYAAGTVFKITTNGVLTSLVSFGNTNGAFPYGGLVQGLDGTFYGLTAGGGTNSAGTLFSVTTNGLLSTLLPFGGPNGSAPQGGLARDNQGNLYGVRSYGGVGYNGASSSGDGIVFRVKFTPTALAPAITAQPVSRSVPAGGSATFSVQAASTAPLSFFWQRNGSVIAGATQSSYTTPNVQVVDSGSHYSCLLSNALGSVLSSNAVLTVLPPGTSGSVYAFSGAEGGYVYGSLVQGADGRFYGTTAYGGAYQYGTVFSLTTNGAFTTLVSFNQTNGASPYAGLVQGADGNFYGTTYTGGANNSGTVFRMTANGTLTTLSSFNYPNGSNPRAALIQGADGNLYGTTEYGGTASDGTVFRITTNGILTTLVSFSGANGANPYGGLVQGADGNFYGTTANGGSSSYYDNYGTVFRMTPNGTLTTLVANGAGNPQAGLVQGADGNFYGTTAYGAVVSVTTNGTLTTLGYASGKISGGLVQGADGNLYGTTSSGGTYGQGTVFVMATNGAMVTVYSFAGTDGAAPHASLLRGNDGNYYGTTAYGGVGYDGSSTSGDGTVFRAVIGPPANDQCSGAAIISSAIFSTNQSTVTASSAGDPVPSCLSGFGKGVWFKYTAPADGQFVVDTLGSSFDTGLAVYTGACGALTEVACNNDIGGYYYPVTASGLTNSVVAGTTYYMLAGGAAAQPGNLVFHFVASVGPPVITAQPTNQTLPPLAPASFSVSVDGAPPLSYAWRRNGSPIAGATDSTYTLTNVALSDSGNQFSCLVSNRLGSVLSTSAMLTVVPVTAPGVTLATLASFDYYNNNNGSHPYAGLIQGADGYVYGTTANGGYDGDGSVFRMSTNGALTNLVSFYYYSYGNYSYGDGAFPYAGLVQAADGNFYGTTAIGGTNGGYGTVYRMMSDGTFAILASFNGFINANPYAGLVQGADGNFYGTTTNMGTYVYGYGTVFRMTTNGTLSRLVLFTGDNGAQPYGELVQGADGTFYGTTSSGGSNNVGTVFRVTTNGTLTTLVEFNRTNGAAPYAGLVHGNDGNFYGVTSGGGTNGAGTVFKLTAEGSLTTLYSFSGGADGSHPIGGLAQGRDGNFYGTTRDGGTYGDGTLFRVGPNGGLATLLQFDGYNGAHPAGRLLQAADGNFYGTTVDGGAGQGGTVFQLSFNGPLHITTQPVSQMAFAGEDAVFSAAATGTQPISFHWRTHGTNIIDGGNVSGAGTPALRLANVTPANAGIYQVVVSNASGSLTSASALLEVVVSPPVITAQPSSQTALAGWTVSFSVEAEGDLPLYYQWQHNGTNLTDGGNTSGSAASDLTITNVDATNAGSYSVLVADALGEVLSDEALLTVMPLTIPGAAWSAVHPFSGASDGGSSSGPLVQGADGNLYGTTGQGGTYGYGTVFRLASNGALTTMVSFNYTNGAGPSGALVQGADGNFYGTTEYGGNSDGGTVFRMSTNGTLTTLGSFYYNSNGRNPSGLVQGADGNFYGTTTDGGFFNGVNYYYGGTVFRLNTNYGFVETMVAFSTDGHGSQYPSGGLVQAADGNLYGMTSGGGTYGYGTVFRMGTNGGGPTLVSFNGANGAYPRGALVQGADGNFYGTTEAGGAYGYGTVFRMARNGTLTTLVSFDNLVSFDSATGAYNANGANPEAALVQGTDGNFYGTTASGGLGGYGTVFKMTPAGTLTTLVWFNGANGSQPVAPLLQAANGRFYGTTANGGLGFNGTSYSGNGAIFQLTVPIFVQNPITELAATDAVPYSASLAVSAVAPDGDTLTFAKISGPAWLAVAGTGALSGTPASADVGTNTFVVSLTDTNGSSASATLFITVNPAPPTITAPPMNQTVSIGATAGFSVTASGTTPLAYSWRRNGAPIAGASASTYNLANAQLADSGSLFSCLVTNAWGSVTSAPALLKVNTTLANDQCAGAIVITSDSYTNSQSTTYATSTGDPVPSCVPGFGNGVWYQFTPSESGQLVVDTFGSDFDTGLAVYTGSCGSLTEIACNDDAGGINSQVSTSVTGGATYRVLAGGYGAHSGNLVFHLAFSSPTPAFLPGSLRHFANGQFQFALSGALGSNYQIRVSTDLLNWSNWPSITLTNNPLIILDTNTLPRRFYRARLVP